MPYWLFGVNWDFADSSGRMVGVFIGGGKAHWGWMDFFLGLYALLRGLAAQDCNVCIG